MRPPLVALLALLLILPSATGQLGIPTPRGVVVNLKWATNHGCSDDPPGGWFTPGGPDFRVRILRDGAVLHTSAHLQDNGRPEWFSYAELPDLPRPATLSIEVQEAEPAPTDAVWVRCDITPESGELLQITVGAAGVAFDSQGEGTNAARLVGKAGPLSEGRPGWVELKLENATHDSIRVGWPRAPGEVVTYQKLESFFARDHEPAPTDANYTVTGLRPSWPYDFRLFREGNGYSIRSPGVEFGTLAHPPVIEMFDVTAGYEEANLSWRTSFADSIEFHVGSEPGFEASQSTRRDASGALENATMRPLPSNVRLYVAAIARGAGGVVRSDDVEIVVLQRPAPPMPEDARVDLTHAGAEISWAAPTVAGVARHELTIDGVTYPVASPESSILLDDLVVGRSYRATLRAVNENGLFSEAALDAFVYAPPNEAPAVDPRFASAAGRAGAITTLTFPSSDPDGDPLAIEVDWGDGGAPEDLTGKASSTHVYAAAGRYTATVRVRDHLGGNSSRETMVDIAANAAPLATLALSPTTIRVGEVVRASAAGTRDPDDDALTYHYDWGDGSSGYAPPNTTHLYRREGRYEVRLEVTDALQASSTATAFVVVTPAPSASTPSPTPEAPVSETFAESVPESPTPEPSPAGSEVAALATEGVTTATPPPPTEPARKVVVPGPGLAGALLLVALLALRRPR